MIDWTRVSELRRDIGADDFDDLIDVFLEEVGETLADLRAATTNQALELGLHALKNSALNLGLVTLADDCEQAERVAASSGHDLVSIAHIERTAETALSRFQAEISSHLGADPST